MRTNPPTQIRVLAVDDDPEFSELIAYNLRRFGCEVFLAPNGMTGLKLARLKLPDVILLDLMLPDLDGITICQILNLQPSTRDIPVFIVSALDESPDKSRRARFSKYFRKPIDLKELEASVSAASRERRGIPGLPCIEPSQS